MRNDRTDVGTLKPPIKVCAIVINYFGIDRTARCIHSLSSESLSTLLLVDNSGTDDQRQAVANLIERTNRTGVPFAIHSITNDENIGFGHAINRAIASDRLTTGGHDYYLLLNNDAEATPGLVAGLLEIAQQDRQLALIAPRIRWGHDEVTYFWYQPVLGSVSRRSFPGSFKYLSGCCLLCDSSLLSEGKLFDEDFFMYGEDVALTVRAVRAGRRVACADDLLAIHEGASSSRAGSPFYEYHVARGHILLADKLSRGPLWHGGLLFGRSIYLLARAVLRASRSRSMVPLKAYLSCWTSLAHSANLEK